MVAKQEEKGPYTGYIGTGAETGRDGGAHALVVAVICNQADWFILQNFFNLVGRCPGYDKDRVSTGLDGCMHRMKQKGFAVPWKDLLWGSHSL